MSISANLHTPVRQDIRKIASWDDVDAAMGVLRRLEAARDAELAHCDQAIRDAEERKRAAAARHDAGLQRVEGLIAEYAEAHKDEVCDGRRRSWKGHHGTVGWRTTGVRVEFENDENDTLNRLRARGHDDCIIVREKVDKNALKGLPASEVARCGVTLSQDEQLYVKTKPAPVDETPGA